MGCKPEGSATNLLQPVSLPVSPTGESEWDLVHPRTTECRIGEHKTTSRPKPDASNYFCIFVFYTYRQISQTQRSLFSVLKALMLQSKDPEKDCWVAVTTINTVTMKEELLSAELSVAERSCSGAGTAQSGATDLGAQWVFWGFPLTGKLQESSETRQEPVSFMAGVDEARALPR